MPAPPPTKKRKLQVSDDINSFAAQIKKLEDEITRATSNNNASLNSLADLVDLAGTSSQAENTSKAIYALYRVFVLLINGNKLKLRGRVGTDVDVDGGGGGGADGADDDDAAKVVKVWLWERLNMFTELLGGLMKDEEKSLRISALQILFSLQKHLSSSYSTQSHPQFHVSHFRKIISYLLLCPPSARQQHNKIRREDSDDDGIIDPDVLNHFVDTWFSVYDDVRWFFLRDAATLLSKTPAVKSHYLPSNLLSILERLTTFPTEEAELNAWWVPELGAKPPKPKRVKQRKKDPSANAVVPGESSDDNGDDDDDDGLLEGTDPDDDNDWRRFFDEEDLATRGGDAKNKNKKQQPRAARLHTLTIHQSLHSLASHRAVFTRAWLTLLPRLVGVGEYDDATANDTRNRKKAFALRALNVMHRGVMPHLTRAVLVMDWIGSCVDYGGTVGLLAFNALFLLIKDYNLDYPSFYARLYAFLDRDVLHLKFRARFFRLMELFLSSSHLPAAILASFVKRLSRLSVSAPPAAIVMVIPFTYNILKRHPALMVMIHRTEEDEADDPFLPQEPNPLLTQALSSSLWELYSHRSHYHSSVSSLSKILSEAFTKPGYAMEDFLDHTYHTLFDAEASHKIKKEPALAMEIDRPMLRFPGRGDDVKDESVQPSTNVISDLWTF